MERTIKKSTEAILYFLEFWLMVGIWFLLSPDTWGERVVTLFIMIIVLAIIASVSYFDLLRKAKDRPKS